MNYAKISDIIIPENRQRKEFSESALDELAESILNKGLLHPIVLRFDNRTLLAGERRFRALSRLAERGLSFNCNGEVIAPGTIPYTRIEALSPIELFEAELEENTIRSDLTWQERNEAIAKLHQLREMQAEEKGTKHTQADTARELVANLGLDPESLSPSVGRTRVAKALTLAEHLDDPDVAAAKSEREALKIIEKKAAASHRARLAESFTLTPTKHTYLLGDSHEILPTIEPPYDILITDPPYGVGADSFGDQAGAKHEYADDINFAIQCYALAFANADRLRTRACFAFCDIRIHPTLVDIARQVMPGWKIWDTPLIWAKGSGMLPVPEKGPRRTYEAIFYAYRSSAVWGTTGSSDIFQVPGLSSPAFGAEKPVELYSDLLSRVALPGDRVIDPFAGTCPVIGAANNLQLIATAIEVNKEKIDYAKVRYSSPSIGDSVPREGD